MLKCGVIFFALTHVRLDFPCIGRYSKELSSRHADTAKSFLASMPKLAWQQQDKAPAFTGRILRVLRDIAVRSPEGSELGLAFQDIQVCNASLSPA